jgi:hypothetical protein
VAKVKPFKGYKALTKEFPSANQWAIEKIDARIAKDVRASSATFGYGILQHIDKAQQEKGRLRRLAEKLRSTTDYHAERGSNTKSMYMPADVPTMARRDVRQMRSHKPGVVPKPDSFR